MKNLNLIFNKLYYDKLGADQKEFDKSLEDYNKEIFGTAFDHDRDYIPLPFEADTFSLKVLYPGLLIGTGNPHGSHKSTNDINMGFSFDYVTGQPYIPGSSVKGVIRSHFKERTEAVRELISVVTGKADVNISELEKEIFDNSDVFYDAVLFDGDRYGYVMGRDYITPHSSPFKNPVPISIIKVLSDVRFEFRFSLTDGKQLTAKEKKAVFKELLILFGVGAKTNTGYGRFESAGVKVLPKEKPLVETDYTKSSNKYDNRGGNKKSYPPRNINVDTSEKIICPNCKKSVYKYNRYGKPWTECFFCKKPLN